MTNADSGKGYLRSARRRLEALRILNEQGGYNDVVREAQEVVELALKAAARAMEQARDVVFAAGRVVAV
ncbi:MAG TPA: HEPN domain-containing protein [Polyangiaceae bacterium]